jgi:hypothetical protein
VSAETFTSGKAKVVSIINKFKYGYMKQMVILLLVSSLLNTGRAQKIVEKHIDFSQKKWVVLNIQIADSIKIITWNKNEVYVKASINVNDNQDNDDYKMVFDEAGSSVDVSAKFEFPKGKNGCGFSGNCNCNCNYKSDIYTEVFIPENVDFSVESINANITISGNTAKIRAHSISGFIDLTVPPKRSADLKLSTISGTMYSDFDFQTEDKNVRRVGGNSIITELNSGGGKPISLETISGDIFLRKSA